MSSELEESTDHPDEPNVNSDAILDQSFEEEKGNGPREHAKPRRRRRGKKRKQKKESAAPCEAENHEECESELHPESDHGECDSPEWGSDDNLTYYCDTLTDVMIRPVNVPKAPLNSTQFIMDDHVDCRFYMSFETPNPYGDTDPQLDRVTGDIIEPIGEDAAYTNIDYQYESPQDFDNSAYYDQEFEQSYKNNRFEELMRFPRNDLIQKLQSLESRLKELNEDLVKENPSPVLEKLQAELLELQEKNSYLKDSNEKLTTVLLESSEEFSERTTREALAGVSVSSASQDEHESEDSERDVYKECNEVVMSECTEDVFNRSSEVEMDQEVDQGMGEKNEGSDQLFGEGHRGLLVDPNKSAGHTSDKKVDEGKIDPQTDQRESTILIQEHGPLVDSSKLLLNSETDECPSSTTVESSQDAKSQYVYSHSHIMHCQPNSLAGDDLRTLNIISSDLFHNASQTKCSSSVPLEGGMSPSETSVN